MILLLSLLSCDVPLMCTEIGCGSTAPIRLQSEGEVLPEGTYTIQIDGDGENLADCLIRMSMDTEECAGEQPCAAESTCNAIYATNAITFTISPGAETYTVSVSLEHQDSEGSTQNTEIEDSFSPQYNEFRPNGEGCDPVCLTPKEDLTLTIPEL